jgi:ABC-type glycerol-3-phosphate transport system substrate-binding protein
MPAAPSGERLNASLMTGLAIMADSVQKDLAWELMAFIVGETSEEALRFVAANTLETSTMWYRSFPDERYETLKEVMAREIVHAVPAPFNQKVTHPDAYPVLTLEELKAMADPEEGKAILARAAGLLDAATASMKAK